MDLYVSIVELMGGDFFKINPKTKVHFETKVHSSMLGWFHYCEDELCKMPRFADGIYRGTSSYVPIFATQFLTPLFCILPESAAFHPRPLPLPG